MTAKRTNGIAPGRPSSPPKVKPSYATGKSKKTTGNEAAVSVNRKLLMMVDLLTKRRIKIGDYHNDVEKKYRTFLRDIQQLRELGKRTGLFTIAPNIIGKQIAELTAVDGKMRTLSKSAARAEILMAMAAQAFGGPMLSETGTKPQADDEQDDFFVFALPKLSKDAFVTEVCQTLREAYSSRTGRATVRFNYLSAGSSDTKVREVEPYRIIMRSGCYYLVGYDVGAKDWRTFLLDRFKSKPTRAGTCLKARAIPPEYASNDVIGFMKTIGKLTDVTVELSALVAESATARIWQAKQRIERLPDGRAQMTFEVAHADEVVRWAMGFGSDAKVVSPPDAVALARDMANRMAEEYAAPTV